jgi:hypothetical protein
VEYAKIPNVFIMPVMGNDVAGNQGNIKGNVVIVATV